MIATKIKNLPQFQGYEGHSALYRMNPPLQEDGASHQYVIVAATTTPSGPPEQTARTAIVPADAQGNIAIYTPLNGSYDGGLSHEKALGGAGYKIEPGDTVSYMGRLVSRAQEVHDLPKEAPYNDNERLAIAALADYYMGGIGKEEFSRIIKATPLNDLVCLTDRMSVTSSLGSTGAAVSQTLLDVFEERLQAGENFVPNDRLKQRVAGVVAWVQGQDSGQGRLTSHLNWDGYNEIVRPAFAAIGFEPVLPAVGKHQLDAEIAADLREKHYKPRVHDPKSTP